jgi:hypothetical protein
MRSFWLNHPDGREATGAGCLLGIVIAVVLIPLTVLGFVVNPFVGALAGAVASASARTLFRAGSWSLKRRGIEVWKSPGGYEPKDDLRG